MYQLPRLCLACGFERTPERKIVTQNRKKWAIFTCRYCKAQDIEKYVPLMLWTGDAWEKESEGKDAERDDNEADA